MTAACARAANGAARVTDERGAPLPASSNPKNVTAPELMDLLVRFRKELVDQAWMPAQNVAGTSVMIWPCKSKDTVRSIKTWIGREKACSAGIRVLWSATSGVAFNSN